MNTYTLVHTVVKGYQMLSCGECSEMYKEAYLTDSVLNFIPWKTDTDLHGT